MMQKFNVGDLLINKDYPGTVYEVIMANEELMTLVIRPELSPSPKDEDPDFLVSTREHDGKYDTYTHHHYDMRQDTHSKDPENTHSKEYVINQNVNLSRDEIKFEIYCEHLEKANKDLSLEAQVEQALHLTNVAFSNLYK